MQLNKLIITPMTKPHAQSISLWKYDGEYSFYDQSEEGIEELMDGTHYACTQDDDELVGYFCFGKGAQIPTIEENVYDNIYTDIGLGLRPDLTGKGMGLTFFKAGLDYAENNLGIQYLRLSVATFNERAIKLYKNAGFIADCEVTNSYYNNKFLVMKKEPSNDSNAN